jgi:serine/threonine protein phosphatase PrpC
MRIRYAARTDTGMKRGHNEDFYHVVDEENLFIVADGMGGHSSGEVASHLAAKTIDEFFRRTQDEEATWPYRMDPALGGYIENRIINGIKWANHKIFDMAARDLRFKGMGTTVVIAQIQGDQVYVAHVGDSRCYRIRGDEISQITRDHSLLEDYKDARPDMTLEEERNFPHRNVITRALGMRDTVQVDLRVETLQQGDMFLLCSDGLSGMVPDEAILEAVKKAEGLEPAVDELIRRANDAGGIDNSTVLLLECANST